MHKLFKKTLTLALVFTLFATLLVACQSSDKQVETDKTTTEAPKELKKVDFLLDWTPNTNHTGLYVAKEKGYLAAVGIDLDIKQPGEESTSGLVINNKAPFGIYFQDSLANKVVKNAPITAVAAIIENNTLGILSRKEDNILRPKDIEGKKYATWDDPLELATIKYLLNEDDADFEGKTEKVPQQDNFAFPGLANKLFDVAPVYYAWDKVFADASGLATNFFYYKDFQPALNFYSPIIIANNDYLKNNKDEAKAILAAIKKGYQDAIANPEEAAQILIKHVPELEKSKEAIIASQKYLATQYATNPEKWGHIDAKRWHDYYQWINDNEILKIDADAGFDTSYID